MCSLSSEGGGSSATIVYVVVFIGAVKFAAGEERYEGWLALMEAMENSSAAATAWWHGGKEGREGESRRRWKRKKEMVIGCSGECLPEIMEAARVIGFTGEDEGEMVRCSSGGVRW
ncbi:hypothetical protein HAX54_023924 [Datura stramonium]|uniref:Uncharacterized protein n=1 Tax=Datura stramonium TaxID=4076 RepID=A0ABS8UYU6_DATST|nr:hypothetical protein [Datura stramonium]